MCLLRDWQMCMIYSVSFEIVELSLMWLIPEFQECWWDSVFMDMLGANMLGMFMGQLTLRYLSCKEYVWEPLNTNAPFMAHAKHFMKRFTPFSWSEYYWPKDWKSWWLSSIMWIGALILEVNSFLIIHAFGIRPSHWILTARLILLGAQGAQSVPEWYEYVRGKTFRIGHNCWIVFMIGAMEVLLAMRYGRKGESYGSITPPTDILMIHATFLTLWLLWYIVSSYRGSNGRHRARTWLVLLRVIAHVPLLFLIRRWAV
jgi:phosphatidylserine synthase 2